MARRTHTANLKPVDIAIGGPADREGSMLLKVHLTDVGCVPFSESAGPHSGTSRLD